MGAIGGLDVAYGAQLQVVRTNLLLVEATTNNVAEYGGKNVLELAQQGLPALLKPDLIYCTDDTDADIEDVAWSAATIFQGTRDVPGTGSTTFTAADHHGLVRDIREVPVAPGSVLPKQATTALGTVVGFTGGKFNVEAILSIGAIELSTMDGASPAATLLDPYSLAEGTPNTFADGPNTGVVAGVDGNNVYSRAMQLAFNNSQVNATMAVAGAPAGGVGILDLSGICEFVAAGFAGTGADFAAGDLATLNTGDVTLGTLNDGAAGSSTAYAWDDIDDELANNAAIISVVSLCRVA
jgi:hypothetical protein